MTKQERKELTLERKKQERLITIERKNVRKVYVKNGGRF